jgi:hypothetical protein
MMPISFNEMECPITKIKEYRKVAKVQPDYIKYVTKEDENDFQIEQEKEIDDLPIDE